MPIVTIPDSVTNIGDYAFYRCDSLTNVTIGHSVTSVGDDAFAGTRLASVVIPNSVTSLGVSAFSGCGLLTNISIGKGVTNIPMWAFFGCNSLTEVTIPNSVASIGDEAFGACDLTEAYFLGNAPPPASQVFLGEPATAYYLPGATGSTTNFDGIPTALWTLPNPMILTTSTNFGVGNNGFSFAVSWASNARVVVEASTNLAAQDWQPLQTNTIEATNGAFTFRDPDWATYPARFYRIVPQ